MIHNPEDLILGIIMGIPIGALVWEVALPAIARWWVRYGRR
jgi:hypothetical protein